MSALSPYKEHVAACNCGDQGEEVELGMTEQNEDNVAVSF
jgi:hypothetical protein